VKSIDVQGISAETQERNFAMWGVPEARRDELRRMLVGMPGRSLPTADRTLTDGERLDIPGIDLFVLATPGHTPAVDPDATVWTIAQQLTWTSGWDRLAGFYRYSALAQTAMHRDYCLSA